MTYYFIDDSGWVTQMKRVKDYSEAVETAEQQMITGDDPNWIIVDEKTAKIIVKSIKTLQEN